MLDITGAGTQPPMRSHWKLRPGPQSHKNSKQQCKPHFVWPRPAALACFSGGVRLRGISRAMSGDSRLVSGDIDGHDGDVSSGNLAIAKPADRSTVPLTPPVRIISGVNKRSSTKGRIDSHYFDYFELEN